MYAKWNRNKIIVRVLFPTPLTEYLHNISFWRHKNLLYGSEYTKPIQFIFFGCVFSIHCNTFWSFTWCEWTFNMMLMIVIHRYGGKVLFGCNVKNWQTNQRQKWNEKFINKSNFDPLAVDLMTCNVKKSRDFTILYICVRPQTFSSGISHTCFITSRSHIIIMLFVFDTKSTKREKSYEIVSVLW